MSKWTIYKQAEIEDDDTETQLSIKFKTKEDCDSFIAWLLDGGGEDSWATFKDTDEEDKVYG